jgi:hypothetical protein
VSKVGWLLTRTGGDGKKATDHDREGDFPVCQYLTLLLPKGTSGDVVARACGYGDHGFPPIHNPSLLAQAEPGDQYFRATRGMCDCDTSLGRGHDGRSRASWDEAAAVARLRKKGWREARIARWLEEKRANDERTDQARVARIEANYGPAGYWVNFLHHALTSGATPRVTLLLHWYGDGGLETTVFPTLPRETVPLSAVTPEFLTFFEQDRLYDFVLG